MGRFWRLVRLALVLGALVAVAYYAATRYGELALRVERARAEAPEKPDENAVLWDAATEKKRIEHNRKLIEGLKDALKPPPGEGEN